MGIPIPVLDEQMLLQTTIRDRDIMAQVIDYSTDYPERTGKVVGHVSYEELKSGQIELNGKKVEAGGMSSYAGARKIAAILQDEIKRGDFTITAPIAPLPVDKSMKAMKEN